MSSTEAYRLTPGAEVLRLDDDTVVLKSHHAAVELKGASATIFEQRIVPALDGRASVGEIAQAIGLSAPDQLVDLLAELNAAGLLLKSDGAAAPAFVDYAEALGLDRAAATAILSDLTVAVLGLGEVGRDVARHVAALGPKRLTLCDPYADVGGGETRQARLQAELRAAGRSADVAPLKTLDAAGVEAIAREHAFLVSCYGPAFPAVDHWANRAAHAAGKPVLFCNANAGGCVVGPLVLPFETACHACWQMRRHAAVDDFEAEMAFAEQTAARAAPRDRAIEPSYLAGLTAGMAANELVKAALAIGRSGTTDAVLQFEPFAGEWRAHALLRRPDCPVCAKKNF